MHEEWGTQSSVWSSRELGVAVHSPPCPGRLALVQQGSSRRVTSPPLGPWRGLSEHGDSLKQRLPRCVLHRAE